LGCVCNVHWSEVQLHDSSSCCLNAEKPSPGHPLVNIKLDEKLTTEQVNSVGQPAIYSETVFEMNYSSGRCFSREQNVLM